MSTSAWRVKGRCWRQDCPRVQGCTGGDWAVRLQATEVDWSPQSKDADKQEPQRASLLFYIGSEQVVVPPSFHISCVKIWDSHSCHPGHAT